MNTAFGITPDDVATVLSKNWARVGNARGMSFDALGELLLDGLDADLVEREALKGGVDLDDQTTAAHVEIERQLVESGFLDPLKAKPGISM